MMAALLLWSNCYRLKATKQHIVSGIASFSRRGAGILNVFDQSTRGSSGFRDVRGEIFVVLLLFVFIST
jgi:hypothetical protein